MTVHTMVAELRGVWLRHGGREGRHGPRGEAVTVVWAAEHVEAAHTRMVHLKRKPFSYKYRVSHDFGRFRVVSRTYAICSNKLEI